MNMHNLVPQSWKGLGQIESMTYICGHCGDKVAAHLGYLYRPISDSSGYAHIYICPGCGNPTTYYRQDGMLVPGSLEGYSVTGISKPMVESLYSEARLCYSASAFTAVVLCCRKLLMHIAVVKGAEEDKGFSYYAKFLLENHYVPPDAASWVKFIVEKGNQSNHEIMKSEREDAKLVLQFVGMLLKNVFEFPALSAKAVPPVPPKK